MFECLMLFYMYRVDDMLQQNVSYIAPIMMCPGFEQILCYLEELTQRFEATQDWAHGAATGDKMAIEGPGFGIHMTGIV